MVKASIDIAATPAAVRAKFLDFGSIPTYHNGFFKSIKPTDPNTLKPGDKMDVELQGMTFNPIFLENSEKCFRWVGSIPYIFTGEHVFTFEPSKTTPGGTTFSQEENFTGLLGFMMSDGYIGNLLGYNKQTQKGWDKYNVDLKAACEKSVGNQAS